MYSVEYIDGTNIHIAMDKTSNDTLIALFEMLNERLHKIEEGNNTLINCLKNKCFKKRVLDKDLFHFPADVRTHYHSSNKFEEATLVYVAPVILEEEVFSIYKKHNFDKLLSFISTILPNEQVKQLQKHNKQYVACNNLLTCRELSVESSFLDIDHHIINEYVKYHCKKVQRVVPVGGRYDFVLGDVSTYEEAVECISVVFALFDCPLKQLVSECDYIDIVICPSKYWVNLEVLCNTNSNIFNWTNFPQDLELCLDDVSKYICLLENTRKNNWFGNSPIMEDAVSVDCSLDTMYEVFDLMAPSDNEDDEEI